MIKTYLLLDRLEEYDSLRELVDALPQGAAELAELSSMFESVGLGEDSVRALLRLGDPKGAIDSCIRLNHWERCARGIPLPDRSGLRGGCTATVRVSVGSDVPSFSNLTWGLRTPISTTFIQPFPAFFSVSE